MTAENIVGRYETITPQRAEEMLGSNEGNRPLRKLVAADYAAQMKRGEWGTTAQPIIMDTSGRVIDGQHRLTAVVMSGIPASFMVVRGASPEQYKWLDRHAKRRGADVLSVSGEQNTVALASCLSWLELYERRGKRMVRGESPTGDRILSLAARWPEARASIAKFAAVRTKHRWMSSQCVAAAHALATRYVGSEFADAFLHDLHHGVGMVVGDPIWRLRELMISNMAGRTRLSPDYIFGVTLKAINMRISGRTISQLRMNGGENGEVFPVVIGDRRPAAVAS